VQLRDTQVRQLTATKCRIKALLLYEGIAFPGAGNQWSAAGVARVGNAALLRGRAL